MSEVPLLCLSALCPLPFLRLHSKCLHAHSPAHRACRATLGAPTREAPTSAVNRATSVASSSDVGNVGRINDPCTIEPGLTSSSIVTMSIAAGGGCDSRSSRMSVRRIRASAIGAGRLSVRSCVSRVTSRNWVRTATAPRSARWSAIDNRSHDRASTKASGSSPSIGHSSSRRSTNPGVSSIGTNGAASSPHAA